MAEEQNTPSVPYISFKTLENLLQRLEPEPPPRIDKSVLSYLSGGYSMQTLAGLRDMGLIDANGTPSEEFVKLVTDQTTRKQTMAEVFRRTYAAVFDSVEVVKATSGQLDEAFVSYGLTGETKKKALLFFIKGAAYCDIELSSLITGAKIKRTPGGSTHRRAGARKDVKNGEDDDDEDQGKHNKFMGSVKIHPMLQGAIQWLFENGSSWTKDQAETWTTNFKSSVLLVYPTKTDVRNGRQSAPAKDEAGSTPAG